MKTKIILITIAVVMNAMFLKAQNLSWGVTGEVANSSVRISDIKKGTVSLIEGKNMNNISFGIFAKLKIKPLYLKSELLYDYQNGSVTVTDFDKRISSSRLTIDKVIVPIIFGIKIIGTVSIEGGPVYNKIFYATDNFDGSIVKVKSSGTGYRIGIATEIGRLNLNLSYQGITNKSFSSDLADYKMPDQLILGMAIRLSKNEK